MRKVAFFSALVFVLMSSAVAFAGPAPQKVIDLANSQLAALGMDAEVVKAVNAQNAEGKTMKEIKKIDNRWIDDQGTGGTPALMPGLMSNDCAKQLYNLMEQNAFITEIFVTDNQGANVCQTGPTSDYWQGDEDKFTKVFNKGVLVADPKDDEGKTISQVSVPVVDGQTHVGTMTIGVDVDLVP
ncbi:MAG: cache domain-containing protein [Deltaproteobacteria bacterium]|nr:cache domain-containing protein [Deltaproteobacteria bacterium]